MPRSDSLQSATTHMPTYEYTCKTCGQNIEVFQSFSAKPLKKHAVCGGDLQKVFHSRGVVFKGSGWYAKDSKNGATASSDADSGGEKPKKPKEKEKAVSATPKSASSESGAKSSSSKDSPKD
ncbi:MAG TPA: FmdB family zinc ribbon protein [Acidimicrobiia bacterium]